MDTYIIANGGCGERVAAVMLALYQCGFYENRDEDGKLTDPVKGILIVDNDTNGRALVKLKDIIDSINSMNNAIDRDYPETKAETWAPMVDKKDSLDAFKEDNERKALDLITTDAEKKHGIKGIGYAGHVNIGVTVVNAALKTAENQKIFNSFLDNAANREGGGEARFIIIGSTHGGTGAALNTAIAKIIRDYYRENHPERIKVYGLFMLSYYSIRPSDVKSQKIDINPNQFRPSDIEALEAYRGMDLVNGKFDNILFCGFDPRELTSNQHTICGNNQNNRFSIPELIMCAGAYFMFDLNNTVPNNQFLGINLQDNFTGTIHWNNIPFGERLKRCIEKMALLACSMTEEGTKVLGGWSTYLTYKFRPFPYISTRVYLDSDAKEQPLFIKQKEAILPFLKMFWNMLFQISTTVDNKWNTVLFKESLLMSKIIEPTPTDEDPNPDTISLPNGFQWIARHPDADCSVINIEDVKRSFGDTRVSFPTMSDIASRFKGCLEANASQFGAPNKDNRNQRIKLYFTSLFDAIEGLL